MMERGATYPGEAHELPKKPLERERVDELIWEQLAEE